ncbi:MAG: hypothetical protein CR988_01545 [Treponema sp.]|nr:MAG: hypothetical protein CR988_01545 [Treponema sp.]
MQNLNRRLIKRIFGILLFLIAGPVSAFSLSVPNLSGTPLHDNANLLDQTEHEQLEKYLLSADSSGEIQIAVLTIESLEGESLEEYAVKVFETWGLGSSEKDNGVLLLVALNERNIRIEVGYGLEDTLTDMACGKIIRNVIVPNFKSGDYGAGIIGAVELISGFVLGEVTLVNDVYEDDYEDDEGVGTLVFLFIFLVFYAMFGRSLFLRIPILGALIRMLPTSSGSSSSGGFSSGGFSSGGFSGGGGSSGGGGASGGW